MRTNSKRRRSGAASTLGVTLLAVGASSASAQQQLDPLVVRTPLDQTVRTTTRVPAATSTPSAAPVPEQLVGDPGAPAIATGVLSPPSAIDALAGASGVGRTQIQTQFQPESISEVLRTIPGVAVQQTARDTALAVNIRGLQDFGRVNVLIDGMRQNFQRSGHNANGVFYVEPEMLKAIDVTRGPTSTVYGSGAIGGVVAFELVDADDLLKAGERVMAQTKLRWGTNGQGPYLGITGAARIGNFDMVGQAGGRDIEDYRDGNGRLVLNSRERTGSTLLRTRWTSAGHQLSGTFLRSGSDFIDSAAASGSGPRDSELTNTQFNMGYRFQRPDTPFVDASVKVYRNETDLTQTGGSPATPGTLRGFNLVTDGVDASNVSRFAFGSTRLALSYGIDAFRDRVTTFDNGPNGSADEFTPRGERFVGGGFLQSHLTFWSIFDLIGAVRYDTYRIEGGGVELSGERASPKVTFGVRALPGMTLFATYAEGYRAPAVTETLVNGIHPGGFAFVFQPNPALRPETAQTVEGGVNFKYQGVLARNDALRAKVTVFQNKVEDFIEGALVPFPPPFGTFQYTNVRNVTLEGVEFEAAYDARSWFLSMGAQRIRGTNDATGGPLNSVSPDQVSVTFGLRALDGKLTYGARARFVDKQERVATAAFLTSGYSVVDLFANWQATDNIALGLNVDNVADKQYIVFRDLSPSPGLAARLSVNVRLGAP